MNYCAGGFHSTGRRQQPIANRDSRKASFVFRRKTQAQTRAPILTEQGDVPQIESIDQRLQWRLVIGAVKRRAWIAALGASLKGWHVFGYVSIKLAGEAWRRLWRRDVRARAVET